MLKLTKKMYDAELSEINRKIFQKPIDKLI